MIDKLTDLEALNQDSNGDSLVSSHQTAHSNLPDVVLKPSLLHIQPPSLSAFTAPQACYGSTAPTSYVGSTASTFCTESTVPTSWDVSTPPTVSNKTVSITNLDAVREVHCKHMWEYRLGLV